MSNNLNLTQVADGQANPEVPVNDKGGELDAALTETVIIDATNDVTVTSAQYRRCIRLVVTPTGSAKTVTVPAVKRLLVIKNDGANDVDVACGSTSFTLAAGTQSFIYTDGTTNGLEELAVGGGGGGGGSSTEQPFDLATYVPGLPGAASVVFRYNVLRAFTWPVSLTGSVFNSRVAATGTAVFTIKQNGSSIGSLSFAAAGTVPTVTFASAVTFAVNDIITIEAPGTQDGTLADIAFDFLGSRSLGTSMTPFDISLFVNGKPAASAKLLRFNVLRSFVWQASLTGTVVNAGVAATASTVFTIKLNGSSIGTLTFAASGTTATISFAADVFFVPGDVITLESPAQDATLADVAFNFFGSR